MPFIQVVAQDNLLNGHQRKKLSKRLSNAVLKAEGASISEPSAQATAFTHYYALPTGDIMIYGEVVDSPPMLVSVSTPEGLVTDQRRADLAAEVNEIVNDLVGEHEGKPNHWFLFHELPEGRIGGMGQLFQLSDVRAVMKIEG